MSFEELEYLYNLCVDKIEELKYNIYNAQKVIENQNKIILEANLQINNLKLQRDKYIKDLEKFYK